MNKFSIEKATEPFMLLSKLTSDKKPSFIESILKRLGFEITGYELDGTVIIIHTNQDFACHLETGMGRVNFYDWLAGYLAIESDEVYDWISDQTSDEINEMAEIYASDHVNEWEIVEP